MTELGDSFRARRRHRQQARALWYECPHCAALYGTGTKVPPGERCHRDGWKAPSAGSVRPRGETRQERLEAEKPHKCPSCSKRFASIKQQNDHARAKRCELLTNEPEKYDDEIPF